MNMKNVNIDIDTETYRKRRAHVMSQLPEGSIAIVPNAPLRKRNADMDYPHRTESNFKYLTDFPEVEAVIVLIVGEYQRSILFCAGATQPALERFFFGTVMDPKAAVEKYGFDEAYSIDKLNEYMIEHLKSCKTLTYCIGDEGVWDIQISQWIQAAHCSPKSVGERAVRSIIDLHNILAEMRLIKSAEEIAIMQTVASHSATAHLLAMKACFTGIARTEYAVEAIMVEHLRSNGCGLLGAYPPIVAGGANALILHYSKNNCALNDGELVLIDFGGELEGYAADITRTFPVSGKFTPAQKSLYELVLRAQEAAIDCVRPGFTFGDSHATAQRVLIEGLVDLGILKGNADDLLARRLDPDCSYDDTARTYTLYGTGHWIGLDVHDVGDYKPRGQSRILVPGMAMTVKPGVYIRPAEDVPGEFWNIGIRIEDDVVVTDGDPLVLSRDAPKTVKEIESIMLMS